MKAIWKDVSGYENLYKINDNGVIMSVQRKGTKGQVIKQSLRKDGYVQVILCKNGKLKTHLVHRLVALSFLTSEDGKDQVNHKDGNRTNNVVDNLEWCTAKENSLHSHDILEKNTKRVLCVETGIVFPSIRNAARTVKCDNATIQRICSGKGRCKTAGGFHWRYVE